MASVGVEFDELQEDVVAGSCVGIEVDRVSEGKADDDSGEKELVVGSGNVDDASGPGASSEGVGPASDVAPPSLSLVV